MDKLSITCNLRYRKQQKVDTDSYLWPTSSTDTKLVVSVSRSRFDSYFLITNNITDFTDRQKK